MAFSSFLTQTEIDQLKMQEANLPADRQKRTPEQIEAIYSHGQNILVSASAGSGKTYVMVERIIEMIKCGISIDALFVSTFTVKAATELKERLEKRLNESLKETTDKDLRQHLAKQIADMPTADIGTMDSFTQKLVLRYGYLIGISPSFSILQDETEIALLKDRIFSDLFTRYREDSQKQSLFNQLIRNFTGRSKTNRQFREVVYQLHQFMQTTDNPDEWLSKYFIDEDAYTVRHYYPEFAIPKIINEFNQTRADYQELLHTLQIALEEKDIPKIQKQLQTVFFRANLFDKKSDFTELSRLLTLYGNIDVDEKKATKKEIDALVQAFATLLKRTPTLTKTGKLDKISQQIQKLTNQKDQLSHLIASKELSRFVEKIDEIGIATTHLKKYEMVEFLDRYRYCELTKEDVTASDISIIADDLSRLFQILDNTLKEMISIVSEQTEQTFEQAFQEMIQSLHARFDPLFTKKEWEIRFPKLESYNHLYQTIGIIYDEQPKVLPLLELLRDFLGDFANQYRDIKWSEGSLEFSDLSHAAITILNDNQDLQKKLNNHYVEVMVDEYQDNSPIQEKLLDLLSNGHNRFMVGDVKQSIYRFRQADPSIFTSKFETFRADSQKGKLVILKENFRSHKEVVDSVNMVFSHLMDDDLGELTYDQTQELIAGNPERQQSNEDYKATILLYEEEQSSDEMLEDQSGNQLSSTQIDLVIDEIKQLQEQSETDFDFSSVALLVPSRTRNIMILKRFSEAGIPLVADDGVMNYLKSTEVIIMLETLRTINNPLNDYALVSLMKSPMFSFDEDDLSRIAVQNNQNQLLNFYDKVQMAHQKNGHYPHLMTTHLSQKIEQFLYYLETWRIFSKTHLIHELIWKIYNERFYLDYVGALPNGLQRQMNLYSLALRAHHYEMNGFLGLSRFIAMIDHILEQEHDLADVMMTVPKNAVRLMTIHKSKGLEFDYVFVLNIDQKFNIKETSHTKVIAQKDTGIGVIYQADLTNRDAYKENKSLLPVKVLIETLPFQDNKERVLKASLSEKMRLLYVAMTRAVKKLYLVGKISKPLNQRQSDSQYPLLPIGQREKARSFQDWLLHLIEAYPTLFNHVFDIRCGHQNSVSEKDEKQLDLNDFSNNRQSEEIIKALDNLKFVQEYNQLHAKSIELPSLRTPSQLKKAKLFENESSNVMLISQGEQELQNKTLSLPCFDNTETINPVVVGSILHQLMQRLDLNHIIDHESVRRTLEELTEQKTLVNKIPIDKIVQFFKTDLGRLFLVHKDKLHREAPFTFLTEDFESRESFVIRGIIDAYLLFEDRIIVFDYKTDKFKDTTVVTRRYQDQMALYVKALKQAYQVEHIEAYLILFGGDQLEIVSI